MSETDWMPWLFGGGTAILSLGLGYFVFIGVRAIFRGARRTALNAGHRPGSASLRAVVRMAVWSAFFGAYYFFLYFLSRLMHAWAILPAIVGLVAMIWTLLASDRLLTMSKSNVRETTHIAIQIVGVLAAFFSVIWYAAAH
ncbi:MAG: hypothetical protein ABI612_09755 [Betaproteobacteria bacterium]